MWTYWFDNLIEFIDMEWLEMKRSEIRKLDKEFSLYVRSRGVCQRCGTKDYTKLQTSHIFSRRYLRVRFDKDNALCLCASCHFFVTLNHPEHIRFATMILGYYRYKQLCLRRYESPKTLTAEQVRGWWT